MGPPAPVQPWWPESVRWPGTEATASRPPPAPAPYLPRILRLREIGYEDGEGRWLREAGKRVLGRKGVGERVCSGATELRVKKRIKLRVTKQNKKKV